MNDPFECLWILDAEFPETNLGEFKDFCFNSGNPSLLKVGGLKRSKILEYVNTLRRGLIKRYAFSSLTEDPLNITMWSHYANAHKGLVIGFEFGEIADPRIFQKVSYKDHLESWDLLSWAKFMNGEDSLMPIFLEDISIKSSHWKHEKEWRVWRTEPCYYFYRKHEIKEVYFGINCDTETKRLAGKLIDMPDDVLIYQVEASKNPLILTK
jgi:hypothetical protein